MKKINENSRIEITPLTEINLTGLINCVQASFPAPNGEIMAKTLQIYQDEYLGYTRLVCEKALRDRMSLIAIDRTSKTVVGFCIAQDFTLMPSYQNLDINPKFLPLISILDELDAKYRNLRSPRLGETLHAYMLGVHPEWKKQSIATLVLQELDKIARTLDFKTIVAEATGVASQKLCASEGFKPLFEIPYSNFTFNGKEIFSEIKNPMACTLVEKVLFH